MQRDKQLTQNALKIHISLVPLSEVKTHLTRTQVLYIALIKNVLILEIQKAVLICTFTKHIAWQRQLCMMLHCTVVKLKESYSVKLSILQNTNTPRITGN